VDEVGEISLADVVEGVVDLAGEDVLIEVHMTGTSQMDGEDMITVEDLVTRVGTGATAAARVEADHEAMTEEVIAGAVVGAEAAAGAGHVAGAAAGAGAVVGAAASVGVAAGAGAVTMVQHRNAGPDQDPIRCAATSSWSSWTCFNRTCTCPCIRTSSISCSFTRTCTVTH